MPLARLLPRGRRRRGAAWRGRGRRRASWGTGRRRAAIGGVESAETNQKSEHDELVSENYQGAFTFCLPRSACPPGCLLNLILVYTMPTTSSGLWCSCCASTAARFKRPSQSQQQLSPRGNRVDHYWERTLKLTLYGSPKHNFCSILGGLKRRCGTDVRL